MFSVWKSYFYGFCVLTAGCFIAVRFRQNTSLHFGNKFHLNLVKPAFVEGGKQKARKVHSVWILILLRRLNSFNALNVIAVYGLRFRIFTEYVLAELPAADVRHESQHTAI